MLSFLPKFFNALASPILSAYSSVVGGGGGPDVASPSVAISSAPTPSPLTAIEGATSDLTRTVLPFAAPFTLTRSATSSFALFEAEGITKVAGAALSAELVGDLSLSLAPFPSSTATLVFVLVVVAVRGIPTTGTSIGVGSLATKFSTAESVLQLPGSVVLTVTLTGSQPRTLTLPPGIQTNVKINQVVGLKPGLVVHCTSVGCSSVILHVTGNLHRSGLGEISF